MSGDGNPWRSGAAEFDDVGFSLVKRDIEVLMLAVQNLHAALSSAGLDQAQVEAITADVLAGRLPWTIAEGGTGATDAATARSNLGLGSLATVNSPTPILNGGTGQTTQQAALDALAGGVTANRVLRADGTHVGLGQVARADMVNAAAASVIGRSANSVGSPGDIASSGAGQILTTLSNSTVGWLYGGSDDYILSTRGGSLSWVAGYFLGLVASYTTPGSYTQTVPADRYRMTFIAIAGGGGASWTSDTVTVGGVNYYTDGAAGGSGGVVMGVLPCSPGDTISILVGGGGAAGTVGSKNGVGGTDTVVSVGSAGINVDAGYGATISGGTATPGAGGLCLDTAGRLDIISLPGFPGSVGTLSVGGQYLLSNSALGGQGWRGGSRGRGGSKARGGIPEAGAAGAVYIGFMA